MIIDGASIAKQIQEELKQEIEKRRALYGSRPPGLAVIMVGDHPASAIYIQHKREACRRVGIHSMQLHLPASIEPAQLLSHIDELNHRRDVDAILLQLPLPSSIQPSQAMQMIRPDKDVDGFNPINIGKMLNGQKDGLIPCTPLGIQVLLERCGIELCGKEVLIIGRSNIVGKPMAALMMQSGPGGDATVTIAHRHSKDLPRLCQRADILIVAVGQPNLIRAEHVKEGTVVIDVGINKIEDPQKKTGYRIVGDVDFEAVAPKCSWITPVPKGVGPMTIAMLLRNTFSCYCRHHLHEL